MKYKDLITKSDEKSASETLAFTIEEAQLALQGSILNCKRTIMNKEAELVTAKSLVPFNRPAIRTAEKVLLIAQADLASDEALLKELF